MFYTLIVIPHRSADKPPATVPDQYLTAIRAQLDDRRVLGERLLVTGPKLKGIDITAKLIASQGADRSAVASAAWDVLRARFSDLQRHDKIEPWPLGRILTCGEVKTLLANLDDVSAVISCEIAVSGGTPAADRRRRGSRHAPARRLRRGSRTPVVAADRGRASRAGSLSSTEADGP